VRRRREALAWASANRESVRAKHRAWYRANPGRRAAYTMRTRGDAGAWIIRCVVPSGHIRVGYDDGRVRLLGAEKIQS